MHTPILSTVVVVRNFMLSFVVVFYRLTDYRDSQGYNVPHPSDSQKAIRDRREAEKYARTVGESQREGGQREKEKESKW